MMIFLKIEYVKPNNFQIDCVSFFKHNILLGLLPYLKCFVFLSLLFFTSSPLCAFIEVPPYLLAQIIKNNFMLVLR